MECIKDIVIPTLPSEPCNGKRTLTTCVYNSLGFPLLNIDVNQPLNLILNAFYATLVSQQTLITDLKTRVTTLGG